MFAFLANLYIISVLVFFVFFRSNSCTCLFYNNNLIYFVHANQIQHKFNRSSFPQSSLERRKQQHLIACHFTSICHKPPQDIKRDGSIYFSMPITVQFECSYLIKFDTNIRVFACLIISFFFPNWLLCSKSVSKGYLLQTFPVFEKKTKMFHKYLSVSLLYLEYSTFYFKRKFY